MTLSDVPVMQSEVDLAVSGLLDGLLDGARIIDAGWRYRYINAAAATQWRLDASQVLGRTLMAAEPGIEHTPGFASLQRCMGTRVAERYTQHVLFAGGESCWFDVTVSPVPSGILVLSRDVTANHVADEGLREREALFSAAFDSPGALRMVFELDEGGLVPIAINDAALARLGCGREDEEPDVTAFFDAEESEALRLAIQRCFATGRPACFRMREDSERGGGPYLATLSSMGARAAGPLRLDLSLAPMVL